MTLIWDAVTRMVLVVQRVTQQGKCETSQTVCTQDLGQDPFQDGPKLLWVFQANKTIIHKSLCFALMRQDLYARLQECHNTKPLIPKLCDPE